MFVSKAKGPHFKGNFCAPGKKRGNLKGNESEKREEEKNQPSSKVQYLTVVYGLLFLNLARLASDTRLTTVCERLGGSA